VFRHPALEHLDRVEQHRAFCDVDRWGAGRAAREALVDGEAPQDVADLRLDQRHVLIAVVRVVESRAVLVRVHHVYLDHAAISSAAKGAPGCEMRRSTATLHAKNSTDSLHSVEK
jgi:hypothetical protein